MTSVLKRKVSLHVEFRLFLPFELWYKNKQSV